MRLDIAVPEIDCHHCKVAIEVAVGGLTGVDAVAVDVDLRIVAVDFDPSVVEALEVVAAIEDEGYEVPAQAGI